MRSLTLVAIALGAPVVALAQSDHPAPSGAVASIVPLWERAKALYLKSTELMPEEKLSFRPTEQVRTFGQIIGHVVNDHYAFCSSALGEKNPNSQDFEKTTTRDGLLQALRDSFTYCDPVYRLTDAKAMEQADFFGTKGTRLWVLTYNVLHDGEHYGNLVTYFRINGIVPPSTQSGT